MLRYMKGTSAFKPRSLIGGHTTSMNTKGGRKQMGHIIRLASELGLCVADHPRQWAHGIAILCTAKYEMSHSTTVQKEEPLC